MTRFSKIDSNSQNEWGTLLIILRHKAPPNLINVWYTVPKIISMPVHLLDEYLPQYNQIKLITSILKIKIIVKNKMYVLANN